MGMTLEDLQPKEYQITVKGVTLMAKPLKLAHALVLAKVGDVFENIKTATAEQIKSADESASQVIKEVVPELASIDLDMGTTIAVIEQLMKEIEPSDNKELNDKGVSFNNDDPKDQVVG